MLLEPDEGLEAGILCVLNEEHPTHSRASINQIEGSLHFKPIAISIETKRAAIQEATAHVQLSLWVIAHFTKLQQIKAMCSRNTSVSSELPTLPLIVVQKHNWKLLIVCAFNGFNLTSNLSSSTPTITILRGIIIDTTATILGCFIILASLDELRRWVGKEFKDRWFRCLRIREFKEAPEIAFLS